MNEKIDANNLWELEARARELLPQMAYDYYASGANDEITLRENRAAYERITLLPRMLVDVSVRDMGTTVFGEPVSMPILIAPTALQGLAHPEGEIATTRAAGAAKTLTTLATLSTTSIEEAMQVASGPVWFQLYVFRDRAVSASLVQRAEAAGCKAVVLTVDVPMPGRRERDVRNRFTLPDHLSLKNFLLTGCQELRKDAVGSGLAAYIASLFDPALTWKDIEWLAQLTKLPILVKGILRADDALHTQSITAPLALLYQTMAHDSWTRLRRLFRSYRRSSTRWQAQSKSTLTEGSDVGPTFLKRWLMAPALSL